MRSYILEGGTRRRIRIFARPYVLREVLYSNLYAFICADQGRCIEAYRDLRLYTKEEHWGILVPFPREFIYIECTEGLDAFLDGSKFDKVRLSSLVKSAVGRTAFDIDWDIVANEPSTSMSYFTCTIMITAVCTLAMNWSAPY